MLLVRKGGVETTNDASRKVMTMRGSPVSHHCTYVDEEVRPLELLEIRLYEISSGLVKYSEYSLGGMGKLREMRHRG